MVAVPPAQLPSAQASPVVQTSPSSHAAVLLSFTQLPLEASQLSSVQSFPSSQSFAVPASHVPALQISDPLHASPSSQLLASFGA